MIDANEFKAKTLVISGGTRGIGRAIVLEFAKMGVNIAFTYNSNKEMADEQAKKLEKEYGIKARAYALNVLEPQTYKEVFEEIDKDFDRVDFFISNAIISGRAVAGGYTKFMKLKPRGLNNIFTATIITMSGVALGIFIGEDGAHGLHYRRSNEVLRGDQFDFVALTVELLVDNPINFGVNHIQFFQIHSKSLLK